jgi:hypothetical protein
MKIEEKGTGKAVQKNEGKEIMIQKANRKRRGKYLTVFFDGSCANSYVLDNFKLRRTRDLFRTMWIHWRW